MKNFLKRLIFTITLIPVMVALTAVAGLAAVISMLLWLIKGKGLHPFDIADDLFEYYLKVLG